jgi:hypothetical protein
VDEDAFARVLAALKGFEDEARPDVFITNYVYDKTSKRRKTAISYANALPRGRLLTWDETGRFRVGQYLLMHSLIYRLDVLRKCALRLPEHTFYVDNIYALAPLAHMETLYYLDADFYHYFIGREGQSVQEKTMIRRIDQQLAVNRMMVESVDLRGVSSDKKRAYLKHYIEIVTSVSSILLLKEGSAESIAKKDALWRFINDKDAMLHAMLRKGLLGRLLHLPSRPGRRIAIIAYALSRMIVGFN